MEDAVKVADGIELHVSYISKTEKETFAYEGVTYHPVFRSKWALLADRLSCGHAGYRGYLPRMKAILQEVKPDVIHIHGTEECFGMLAPYAGKIPVVYSLQGLLNPYVIKFFSGLTRRQIRRYEPWSQTLTLQGVDAMFSKFTHSAKREALYLSQAQYVMGRTRWDCEVARLFNPDVRYYVVNELLRPEFREVQWRGAAPGPAFHIVSTVSGGYYKGYETLLRAASLLNNVRFSFEWTVIGLAPGDSLVRICESVTGLKSQAMSINLAGRKNAAEMSQILASSDLFCLVSHIENSPNSLCEAMMVGMPIIATDTGGTSSILTPDAEGCLLQDGDPYALAGKIIWMHDHFDDAKQMADKARDRAMKRHDPATVVSELLSAYRSISMHRSCGNQNLSDVL